MIGERYYDKNGIEVKAGDTISFTLYDGEPNKQFVVIDDEEHGLRPLTMKYLEFEIIKESENGKANG